MDDNRRFLVLARVGGNSLHRRWLDDDGPHRSWDLQLNAYGADAQRMEHYDLPTVVDQGTKLDSIARHFRAHPQLLERYDYILLPDDDLLMSVAGINRLFAIMREYDLSIAQPSLTLDSYINHPLFVHCPQFRLRYTNYLEGMACCFRASYLRELLPLFERHSSGWGISHVWALLMSEPAYRAAIVDEVPMTHTRPQQTGALYSQFARMGISPEREIAELVDAYPGVPRSMLLYGGVLRDGRHAGDLQTSLRAAFELLAVAHRSNVPRRMLRKGMHLLGLALTGTRYRPAPLARCAGRSPRAASTPANAAGPWSA